MTYIKEIIFTSIICGIVTGLSTTGNSKTAKYVKYAASLAFLCVLFSPLINKSLTYEGLAQDLLNIANTETTDMVENREEIGLALISNEICKAVIDDASDKFGVPTDCLSMSIAIGYNGSNEYAIQEAKVYVKSQKLLNIKSEVKEYFDNMLNCNVEVIYCDQPVVTR